MQIKHVLFCYLQDFANVISAGTRYGRAEIRKKMTYASAYATFCKKCTILKMRGLLLLSGYGEDFFSAAD